MLMRAMRLIRNCCSYRVAQLVVDLLERCHLDYSLSVLVPEADLKDAGSEDRRAMCAFARHAQLTALLIIRLYACLLTV